MLLLSCKQTCGINAVAIYEDGYLVAKQVTRLPSGLGLYDSYITGFRSAFSFLRCYLEKCIASGESKLSDVEHVVIECNSSVFTNWLRNGEPKRGFEVAFEEMWKELDRIPIMYSLVHSKVVKASIYAKESELPATKLESLDI